MEPVAHVLEYYKTKLTWADAADWPHVHLRERVRHYETVNARLSLREEDAQNKLLEVGELRPSRLKLYYTLCTRDDKTSPWCIHFGDYDFAVVQAEQEDLIDTFGDQDTHILVTSDQQAAINAAVDELNQIDLEDDLP